MSDIKTETVYFEKEGKDNTEQTLKIAHNRAQELGIKQIVIASTTGYTGITALDIFRGYNPVIVTHSTGFKTPNLQELYEENRKILLKRGTKILTCQHTFGGVGRAVRKKLNTYELEELIAYTLRIWGEGMKVSIEITIMAADAGFIRTDMDAIAIAGTEKGADTAIVIKPANAQTFFDMRIKEILCKPRLD